LESNAARSNINQYRINHVISPNCDYFTVEPYPAKVDDLPYLLELHTIRQNTTIQNLITAINARIVEMGSTENFKLLYIKLGNIMLWNPKCDPIINVFDHINTLRASAEKGPIDWSHINTIVLECGLQNCSKHTYCVYFRSNISLE